MPNPRASTDEESRPLLVDHDERLAHANDDEDEPRSNRNQNQSFFSSLTHPPRKLNGLEKILIGLTIALLVLASTFIGLFAGAETQLKKERSGNHGGGHHGITTVTATATSTGHGSHSSTMAPAPTGKPAKNVCLTPDCVRLAASILEGMNTTVDPCDDFYEFANGGWIESHEIPADKSSFGSFQSVSDRNKKIIIKVLESVPSDKHGSNKDSTAEDRNRRKLKAVYNSCMDVDTLNERGLKPFAPLANFVIDTMGDFGIVPAPEDDSDSDSSALYTRNSEEWKGAYTRDYEVPRDLLSSAARVEHMREKKSIGSALTKGVARRALPVETQDSEIVFEDPERQAKITKALAFLASRGVDALINFAIEGDAGGPDSQVQSLYVYQASGGLPSKEYYEEAPILDLYQSVVAGILVDIANNTQSGSDDKEKRDLFSDLAEELASEMEAAHDGAETAGWPWPWPGDDKPGDGGKEPSKPPTKSEPLEKRMDRLAGKVVRFERELLRAGADPEYLFNPHYSYNPYKTSEVEKKLPFMDLPLYLSTFGPRNYPENVTVTYPPYLKSVTRLVNDAPDHVLSAYFVTRLAMKYASALGPNVPVRQEVRRLKEVLGGLKKGTEENRENVCLAWVDEIVGYIAGREFVREAFSPEAKQDGTDIINSIVQTFYDKLPHIEWMDKESAEAAQLKAKSIYTKVGYPLTPNTTSPDSLERYYARLDVAQDDFFSSVLQTNIIEETRTWQLLGKVRDRETWDMYPQTVNAYYSPPDGEIVFPAGILQPPFYEHSWPAHLKYGAFGAVAAHELTHAFDTSGSQYDERGRLRDWWTNSTVKAFEERADCIINQYSKYFVLDAEGKKVYLNGNLTSGENIGDSGLSLSYAAWKSSSLHLTDTNSSAEQLPGLDFTPEQLFFIAMARIWQQITRPSQAVAQVRTDPHSPPRFRVLGTLRNMDEFHKAFQCKSGSGMNPPKKDQCHLW